MVNESDSTYNNFIIVYEYDTLQKSWLINGDTIKVDNISKLAINSRISINRDGTVIAFAASYEEINDTLRSKIEKRLDHCKQLRLF